MPVHCNPEPQSFLLAGSRSVKPAGVCAPTPCTLQARGASLRAQPVLWRRGSGNSCTARAQPVVMAAAAAAGSSFEPAQPAWGPVQLLARAAAVAVSIWRAAFAKFAAAAAAGSKDLDAEVRSGYFLH